MALVSPGIQVTVIDESFYTPAEPGTTPLIVIATAQDKSNAAGTATAAATTKANAGKAFKITSQRELVESFGVPFFEKTASNTPIHGSERNEYGLLAAYSLLGVSNSVFITRADVNLDELEGQVSEPGSEPADGQWWVDTAGSLFGIQEWNGNAATTTGGQKFANKTPIVLTDDDAANKFNGNAPAASVGIIGDYAVVMQTAQGTGSYLESREPITFWYKSAGGTFALGSAVDAGQWVKVGSPEWVASHATVIGTEAPTTLTGGAITINGTPIIIDSGDTVADVVDSINALVATQGFSAKVNSGRLAIYSDGTDSAPDSSTITQGILNITNSSLTPLTELGIAEGEYLPPAVQFSAHTSVPTWKASSANKRPTGSVWIKTTEPNYGSYWVVKQWSSDIKTWSQVDAPLYGTTHSATYFLDKTGGGTGIPTNSLFVQTNTSEDVGHPEADLRIWRRAVSGATTITSAAITGTTYANATVYTFTIAESLVGEANLSAAATVSFTGTGVAATNAEAIAAAIAGAGLLNIEASITASNELQITHKTGGDFRLVEGDNTPLNNIFSEFNLEDGTGTVNLYLVPAGGYFATNWRPLVREAYAASATQPLAEPTDGQLWYNPNFGEVDIMVHNGEIWVGYKHSTSPYTGTDANGPIVAASEPTLQSGGGSLATGDLWISTADLENYPNIYRYDADNKEWVLLDKTDQTTEDGVLFADARYGSSGESGDEAATIKELLSSNYVDPDCPDPALYPAGMLLWNLRRSGGNVKRYVNNYIDVNENNVRYRPAESDAGDLPPVGEPMGGLTPYATDRWVTASANNEDGSGAFGRKAQRKVIVSAMKSVVDTSSEIRDEERRNFNLIAAPGYPELLSNLINLNIDRGLTAFVIGDTPLRLKDDATTLTNWGTNANLVTDNGDDGIVSYDEYAAVYYPNGFTTDLGGSNAVVPASHMMLRTIALSDNVSFPWFAPAGTRRGGITNATSVGYIDAATGEFQTVALNEGQRDTLYELKINPIPFFVGVGHVAYGQKTRAKNASALDRINVARLVVYLRSQLNKLARPYVFEPNDKITRDEIKGAVESLLLELVGLRALYDFAVVCDESNNTAARIDRNELWVDIAIEPVKAVEFIYIPLRLKNTGEI